VLVVSLPGSARRRRIAQRLAAWNGHWSFLDAVDGASLSPEALARSYDESATIRRYGRPLSPGEIGCALSHRLAYQTILSRGLDSAIVLEDDAILSDDLTDFPFASLPAQFDVVNLFGRSGLVRRRAERQLGRYALHRAAGKIYGTVGYVVSRKGAERLLAASPVVSYPADWPVHPAKLSFFALSPPAVGHEDEDSQLSIEREHMRHRWRQTRGLRRSLTEGPLSNLAIPLFLRYAMERDCYLGLGDYCRREIEPHIKRMLPMVYRELGDL
jgi:glycosyl transferase family 25